ncbi:MAG: chemotaxis protein CheD [Deltaproteobacteria bacterium]|nr:chemotaxis protein CheD [Deltaproteobacteria bacterium]TLN02948.1 MAG: chemotaxis protein CheD [bacterium]
MIPTAGTIPTIYLKPGEQYFAVSPAIVSTVLGSCVSITMHSPEHGKSAICHAVLPEEIAPGEPFRYVDSSIAAMLRQFDRHGIRKNALEVKLFGGADILAPGKNGFREMTVGKQNFLRAKQIINREQLNLLAYDVGGTRGRKIFFHTQSGLVYLKRLREVTR